MTASKRQSNQEINKTIKESYDKLPYTSYPFEYNRPENLRTIGILFGMTPPKLSNARILELGCAEGGNITRFACDYPKSYTLGIDLSSVEISHGLENIKHLGLKNIELRNISITDLDESFGKFDYIICHGVYSWVPDFVRKKILEVSKNLLSKNGIAFVSYNTLPGWNMIGTVRELMMYHAANFTDNMERIQQARFVLEFLKDSLEGVETPHAKFMGMSASIMSDREDNYIRHEYLSEENKAFYFNEFISDARDHGLEYLGDSDLHRMYIGNLPANAAEKLGTINDIVRTEQYIDFIKNTQFRCTLMCHKEVEISRNINFERIRNLLLTCIATTKQPETEEILTNNEIVKFLINNNDDTNLSVSSPALKALMYVLTENVNNPLRVDELVDLAMKKIPGVNRVQIEAELAQNVAKLIFSGYFKIISNKPLFTYKISDKPKISDYARFQIDKRHVVNGKLWITNQTNSILIFTEFQRYILILLDGKHTIDEIRKDIFAKFKDGLINANQDNKKIEKDDELEQIGNKLVDQTINYLRMNYGLVK